MIKEDINMLITLMVLIVVFVVIVSVAIIVLINKSGRRNSKKLSEEIELLNQKNEMTQNLFDMTRQLSRHQRLETMGIISSNMNHEFSNLLTPIMGYSLLAIEKVPDDCDGLMSDLERVYESTLKAKELLENFQKMSRKSADYELSCFSPDKLMLTVEALLEPSRPGNVTLSRDYNCPDECLCANETQISQVVMNIVINAFHALEANGGNIHIATRLADGNVEITVSDDGPGISEEAMKHIREPFYTTSEAHQGTGLGIPIAEQILSLYHGNLLIESEAGKGAKFTIQIPANQTIQKEEK